MFTNVLKTINKGINKLIKNQNKYTIKGKDYYEDKLLAEGGYGYVYIVEDLENGIKYALKKMNYMDNEQLVNIKREIDLWKKVNNHSNVVKLFDYEISQTNVLILMELCTEGTLLDLINNRVEVIINENQALFIIKEIASGIHHMHTQSPPIAHRDVKIENVLKVGNNYKLCDFGSCSFETLDPRKESKSTVLDNFSKFEKMTTFMYRPPEMCDPYSKFPIYEKVDIWMLGCILYALLFKQHPFQDAQKLTIINAHYYIPDSAKSYSDKIIDFIRLMLTPNPVNRPSAKDVLNLIVNWNSIKTIDLPDETKEIKLKQLRNVKTNKNDLLSSDDIYKLQQEIMKDQKKKNKFKRKNDDDTDINEIFDDIDIHDSSNHQNAGNSHNPNNSNNPNNANTNVMTHEDNKLSNSSKSPNLISGGTNVTKPFDGFDAFNNNGKNNSNNMQGDWQIDFNQGIGNNNNQISNNKAPFENNFGFDFLEDGGSNNFVNPIPVNNKNTNGNKLDGFDSLNNVFSGSTQHHNPQHYVQNNASNNINKGHNQTNTNNNLMDQNHLRSKSNNHVPHHKQPGQVPLGSQNNMNNNQGGFDFDNKFGGDRNWPSNNANANFGPPMNVSSQNPNPNQNDFFNNNMNKMSNVGNNQNRQVNQNTNVQKPNQQPQAKGDQNIFDFFK